MNDYTKRVCWTKDEKNSEILLTREWLVTNGLGGYSSGTISGAVTRRYHGLLISALPNPYGRTVMLNHLAEKILLNNGKVINLGGEEKNINELILSGMEYLSEFRLELGIPVWHYEFEGYILEKKIIMPHRQNTVIIIYKLLKAEEPVILELNPSVNFRKHENPVNSSLASSYKLIINGPRYEVATDVRIPNLKLYMHNEIISFEINTNLTRDVYYRLEADRGYEYKGTLWSLGNLIVKMQPGMEVTLTASTENWNTIINSSPDYEFNEEIKRRNDLLSRVSKKSNSSIVSDLILAADQFIITPVSRARNEMDHVLQGEEVRTIIAGYHWFTDWGRDTMISLEGLTLTTGRIGHAKWILRTFAHYVKDGLIPNLFPEGKEEGLYHTADASLWFFHALDRYMEITRDNETLDVIFPKLKEIIDAHINGTKFGIHLDSEDCLLIQGETDYQLTWMDAKVEGWVVTPRRGKAVEINALWYNAICIYIKWLEDKEGPEAAAPYRKLRDKCKNSFNRRFWNPSGNYLYDVIDGENGVDDACRPNQIFAISLTNAVLENDKWEKVVNTVHEKLLTPVGLRSLAPGHLEYKEKYFGDLRARDAAYHQGTVWAWLIGPFIDAWTKTYPNDKETPAHFLIGFKDHLCKSCAGSISEIFDAEAPYTPRGCIAQAWSVAEVLRCMAKLEI